MKQNEKRTPEGVQFEAATASDSTQYKDTEFSLDLQVVPCFSCVRWNECGWLKWQECRRFGLWLKLRKEQYRKDHERTA